MRLGVPTRRQINIGSRLVRDARFDPRDRGLDRFLRLGALQRADFPRADLRRLLLTCTEAILRANLLRLLRGTWGCCLALKLILSVPKLKKKPLRGGQPDS